MLISYDNRYFQDKYQGVPKDGFTAMFANMLNHENITVKTNTDASSLLQFSENEILLKGQKFKGNVIYTGALDELYQCRYGRLPYRSLRFEFSHLDKKDFQQGHSVVNYTVSEDFTRITEFKYLTMQKNTSGTTIVKEYPFAYTGAENEIPYYSIINSANEALYQKYQALSDRIPNLYLLGRLAEYKYYNMDAMTKKAMELAEQLKQIGEKR